MSENKDLDIDKKNDDDRASIGAEYRRQIRAKRATKDSVFIDLFSDPEYLLELYKSLFPEDNTSKIEDLKILSLRNLFINGSYNDLGFLVKDKLLILVEAQSTWSPNIPMRMLAYLAYTYRDYEEEHSLNNYGSKLEYYPRPELYVVYTGPDHLIPRKLHLKDSFIGNSSSGEEALDCVVNVITRTNSSGILTEYISFCNIYNDMVKRHGYTLEAVIQTIRTCKDKNILKKYLESRGVEVTRLLTNLFNQEIELEKYVKAVEHKQRQETDALRGQLEDTKSQLDDAKSQLDDVIRKSIDLFLSMNWSEDMIISKVMELTNFSREESARLVSEHKNRIS